MLGPHCARVGSLGREGEGGEVEEVEGEEGKCEVVLLNETSGPFRISTINSVHVPLLA